MKIPAAALWTPLLTESGKLSCVAQVLNKRVLLADPGAAET